MATNELEVKIDKKPGEILLDTGIISRSQLDGALMTFSLPLKPRRLHSEPQFNLIIGSLGGI